MWVLGGGGARARGWRLAAGGAQWPPSERGGARAALAGSAGPASAPAAAIRMLAAGRNKCVPQFHAPQLSRRGRSGGRLADWATPERRRSRRRPPPAGRSATISVASGPVRRPRHRRPAALRCWRRRPGGASKVVVGRRRQPLTPPPPPPPTTLAAAKGCSLTLAAHASSAIRYTALPPQPLHSPP